MLYGFFSIAKQHDSLPFQILLIRLSWVRITFRWGNHMKILILSGTFIFQIYYFRYFVSSSRWSKYIIFTVKIPKDVKPHTKISFSSFNWTWSSCCSSCRHNLQQLSLSVRRKLMFRGFWFFSKWTRCL
jgi:hypothetical protein